ncbi:hypothetical protein [Streptomyces sp. NPDC008092]|uniref:hypothetical protein n=1 Tax=Streptomyces sp. NPDC008092 TaxID=3364808 RepID=UPI0036F09325
MSGRTQHGRRGAWRATRPAVLCHALAMLLTALVMCLGPAAHAAADLATAPMTATSTTRTPPPMTATSTTRTPPPMTATSAAPTAPGHAADHHAVAVTHPGNCPAGGVCCAQDTRGVRAVLPTAVQPASSALPRVFSRPGPAVLACSVGRAPTRGTPDLHVLQVQRT